MKRASTVLVGIFLILVNFGLRLPSVSAITISSSRDFDNNAVISGGALDCQELQNSFSKSGVATIYSSFGITVDDINNICSTAVAGVVTDKDNVWIHRSSGLCPDIDQSTLSAQNQQAIQNNPNLCLVATKAITAGRQNMVGSTAITNGGMTFYQRPLSVSLASSSLNAFVVMNNHRFAFAIIASCGNPVIATAVTTLAPATKSQTTTSTKSTPTATATASVNVTTPAVQAATTTAASNRALPNTGPGDVAAVFSATTIFATVGHWFFAKRRIS